MYESWGKVQKGASWILGDGKSVRFWTDRWVIDKPLIELAIAPIDQSLSTKLVADYWGENREWRWPEFEHLIPTEILMRISAIKIFGG